MDCGFPKSRANAVMSWINVQRQIVNGPCPTGGRQPDRLEDRSEWFCEECLRHVAVIKKGNETMKIFSEFKEFAVRGNVIDLAVGIIIGAAFNKIVSSLVNDIIMPPIGLLVGNVDF